MSKALTKPQIDHLNARIETAITMAIAAYREKLPKPERMNAKQMAAAVKNGEYTIVFNEDGGLPCYAADAIQFTHNKMVKALAETNEKSVQKFKAPLYAEKQRIMDKAILGGAEEALAAMTAFIAKLNK